MYVLQIISIFHIYYVIYWDYNYMIMNIWLTFTCCTSILFIYNPLNISIWLILLHTRYPCYYWYPCISILYIFYVLKSYTCTSHRWFNPSHNPDNHFQNIFITLIVVMCFKTKIVLLILRFAIYYSNLEQIYFPYFLFSIS